MTKICVNSIYGLANQQSSPLYAREIGEAITAFGRYILQHTTDLFQNE